RPAARREPVVELPLHGREERVHHAVADPGRDAGVGARLSRTDCARATAPSVRWRAAHAGPAPWPSSGARTSPAARLASAPWLAGLDRTPRSFPDSPGWRPVYAAIGSRPGM